MRLLPYSGILDLLTEADVEVYQLVENEQLIYIIFRPVAPTEKHRRGRRHRLPHFVLARCRGACS